MGGAILLAQAFVESSEAFSKSGIKVVLEIIISSALGNYLPARELFRDIFPLIALLAVKPEKLVFLCESPGILGDNGRQVIVPPLSTLFSGTFRRRILLWEFVWNLCPVLNSINWNQFLYCLVFLKITSKVHQQTKTFDSWRRAFDIQWALIKWFILFFR